MARKKKTPLYQKDDELDPTYTGEDTDETTTDDSLLGGDVLQSDLFRDQVHSTIFDPSTQFPGPKFTDPTAIDTRIAQIEKPASGTVWDKQAAYYRQKGEGDVLRRQKDLEALTSPTITLWQERTTAANAKFELLKQQIPETDFSTIFGENGISKIPMPIIDEVKNISASIKTDLKELSRMNINDPRYDELRKKVEKDQDMILAFDEINQKLLDIRNDIESNGNDSTQWSDGMSEGTQRMWQDIYTGEGKNIKIIDGKLQWVDPGGVSYDFGIRKGQTTDVFTDLWKEKIDSLGGKKEGLGFLNDFSMDGDLSSKKVKSLVAEGFEGYGDQQTYYVDLGIHGSAGSFSGDVLQNIASIGGADKGRGNSWVGGKYNDKNKADIKLSEVQKMGFPNASIRSTDKSPYSVLKLQRELKKLYPDHDFGNEKWGPKTQAAYEMYLKDKDKLETAYFNEHMSAEDKEKYQVITGEGTVKDLSKIGDEPIMNSAKAQELSYQMQNFMTASIQAGANARGDFAAQTKYKQALNNINVIYDGLNIHEQTSLLFDGMGVEDNVSVNTNGFIESILAANEGKTLDDLIEGGLLESYKDPNDPGTEKTLRTMFKDWYLDEIESKTSGLKPPRVSGGGGGDVIVRDKDKGKGSIKNSSAVFKDGTWSFTNKSSFHGIKIKPGNISMSNFSDNEDDYTISDITGRSFGEDAQNDYLITPEGIIKWYDETKKEWINSDIDRESDDNTRKKEYNKIAEWVNKNKDRFGITTDLLLADIEVEKRYKYQYAKTIEEANFDKIAMPGQNFGGVKWDDQPLAWGAYGTGGDDAIAKALQAEYKQYGFYFMDAGWGDGIAAFYLPDSENPSSLTLIERMKLAEVFETNHIYSEDDTKWANKLIEWMKHQVTFDKNLQEKVPEAFDIIKEKDEKTIN